ncbi:MAG TPA: hypothetical protein VK797_06330 [Tepidisphaeraceae bacterium]|jgi:hypothetical protein|nr:hypothetical protein [Tepidisphaeraceae bacterium]
MELIVKNGYERAGFKHVRAIFVPPADMNLYSNTLAADVGLYASRNEF